MGFAVSVCKQAYHQRCGMGMEHVCGGSSLTVPVAVATVLPAPPAGRGKQRRSNPARKQTRDSSAHLSPDRKQILPQPAVSPPQPGNWNLSSTSQFQDRSDVIITSKQDLDNINAFLYSKIVEMSQDGGRRDTIVDVVFKRALKEFHHDLVSTYSVWSDEQPLSIKYRDLIANFESILGMVARNEKSTNASFPVTLGINAFRGFLDEFSSSSGSGGSKRKRLDDKTVKVKHAKKDKRKKEPVVEHLGHQFISVVINIPTACEHCTSFLLLMQRGMVCQRCKLTCHKKCCDKHKVMCCGVIGGRDPTGGQAGDQQQVGGKRRLFGTALRNTLHPDDNRKIPHVVEKLINCVEMRGLFVEGVYRISGSNARARALKEALQADVEGVDLEAYPVHVVASTLKTFFRELPEPLLTYDLYDDFLQTAELQDSRERDQALFSLLEKLPKANFNLFERMLFHLARVAHNEASNRMSSNALAIVFAPSMLRSGRPQQALESLEDVMRQTACLDCMIRTRLGEVRDMLDDIDVLDSATATATLRLDSLRKSKMGRREANHGEKQRLSRSQSETETDDDENVLFEQIKSLEEEKVMLTAVLPSLQEARHHSCSEDDDLQLLQPPEEVSQPLNLTDRRKSFSSRRHSSSVPGYEEYAITFDFPVNPPSELQHLNKNRVSRPPKRRKPPGRAAAGHGNGEAGHTPAKLRVQHARSPGGGGGGGGDSSIISMHSPLFNMSKDDAIMV